MDYVKSIFNTAYAYVKPVIESAKGHMPKGVTVTQVASGAAAAAAIAGVAYAAKKVFAKEAKKPAGEACSLQNRAVKLLKDFISVVTDFVKKFFSKAEQKAEEPNPAPFEAKSEEPKLVIQTEQPAAPAIEGRYSTNGIDGLYQNILDQELRKLGFKPGNHNVSVSPEKAAVDGKVIARLDSYQKPVTQVVDGVLVYRMFKSEEVMIAIAKAIVEATK